MASHHFDVEHEAFAASRVSQYVYVPTHTFFSKNAGGANSNNQKNYAVESKEKDFTLENVLDQHADTLEGDIKLPLVVLGNEGSGKSALLANWVAKRREHKHRDEFLFQHFVGCSTPSLQLQHTLFRLETALKDFFQLREMQVPETEEELRWSLNRFLAAAAKKYNPARITVIIDGINRLKAEGAPDGALHWLPTELPPCVRFIVSTVEFERIPAKGKASLPQHRTLVELTRRKCPILRIEPLIVNTRHHVIHAFVAQNAGRIELTENQQFKIVTAPATSQPMYLRALLQGIRLSRSVTNATTDQLMDYFLSCGTAHDLLDKTLNICCQAVFPSLTSDPLAEDNGGDVSTVVSNSNSEIVGKIFSVVYASRNGLTILEIWGVIKMVAQYEPDEATAAKLLTILKEFTMVTKVKDELTDEVEEMHSFSHEIYREVVYAKYIKSHDALTRWHYLMARFFGQLPPCPRKLAALPYHLEVAGSWSKVKNCLTDIDMFQLWWTSKFKKDFINFWSSLTKRSPLDPHQQDKAHTSTLSKKHKKSAKEDTNGADHTSSSSRPSYDIVEEYVKSLDEYRTLKHPSDEKVSNIILQIGDFLLEFATLGHESFADVPTYVHPVVPPEDLASIGVPYIIEEKGEMKLMYPTIFPKFNKDGADPNGGADNFGSAAAPDSQPQPGGAVKAKEDLPICTTYFYSRWMWIQFPFIALGNCDSRFQEGIRKLQELEDYGKSRGKNQMSETEYQRGSASAGSILERKMVKGKELSKSMSSDMFKLPEIKFHRKAARSIRRVNHDIVDDEAAAADKFTQRMTALQDDIQNYREEHDFVMQMKLGLTKRLAELRGSFVELTRSAESVTQFDGELDIVIKRETEAISKANSVQTLHKNLEALVIMCDRHPAKMPALIADVELKIEQDKFLLAEIKKRLWEQRAEKNTHGSNFRKMKQLVKEGARMHYELLNCRTKMTKKLSDQAMEDERKLMSSSGNREGATKKIRNKTDKLGLLEDTKSMNDLGDSQSLVVQLGVSWDETWNIISSRTGIIEPEIFFNRLANRSALEEQIKTLMKFSESRLESLKDEQVTTEKELEEVANEASFSGGLSVKDQEKYLANKTQQLRNEKPDGSQQNGQEVDSGLNLLSDLANKTQHLRYIKERSEGTQQLVQEVDSGLRHIAEVLGMELEENIGGVDILREIEGVLDHLLEEREKQLQAQNQSAGLDSTSRMQASTRDVVQIPETSHHRSPELEIAVSKYETPKARLPHKLPSKAQKESLPSARDGESEDGYDEDEGVWDRTFVKTQAEKSLRMERKKNERKGNTSKGTQEV